MSAALKGDQAIRKQSAKELAEGYSAGKRALDCFSVAAFTCLFTHNIIHVARYYVHGEAVSMTELAMFPVAVLLALLGGDMFSGLAHWGFDTWGSLDTPALGPFIRSFREHHVNQASICNHDFIETNGDNCLAALPVLAVYYFLPCYRGGSAWCTPEAHVFAVIFMMAIAVTNQIHKESHERRPSPMAKFLQRWNLILTPQDHRRHHSGAFDYSYCITTGWLNGPLDKIGFWRKFENAITSLTGAIPRADDKKMLGE